MNLYEDQRTEQNWTSWLTPNRRSSAASSWATQTHCTAAAHRMSWLWRLYCWSEINKKKKSIKRESWWYFEGFFHNIIKIKRHNSLTPIEREGGKRCCSLCRKYSKLHEMQILSKQKKNNPQIFHLLLPKNIIKSQIFLGQWLGYIRARFLVNSCHWWSHSCCDFSESCSSWWNCCWAHEVITCLICSSNMWHFLVMST